MKPKIDLSSFKGLFLKWMILFIFLTNANARELNGNHKERSRQFTVKTHHGKLSAEIIYEVKDSEFANRVISVIQEKAPLLSEYFGYTPTDVVHFVVEDESYTANGSATVFPHDVIRLNNFPPIGDEHLAGNPDWIELLVVHEMTHIFHIDQTRSFLKGLKTVFGSLGKLGGVVPRWFSEGVATWAETKFTNSGRLRNDTLLYELRNRLKDPNFCHTIDCLDGPGVYPHGQYAYWIGAYFLNEIENEKPGTISCIIRENSKFIPFNLNTPFIRCTGLDAPSKFEAFRKLEKDHPLVLTQKFSKLSLKNLGNVFFQKGLVFKNNKLVYAQENEFMVKLSEYDFTNQHLEIIKPPYPINNLSSINNKIYLNTTSEEGATDWYSYEKNGFEKLEHKEPFQYLLMDSVYLDYIEGHWSILKIEGEKESILKVFPQTTQVFRPYNEEGRIYLKTYDSLTKLFDFHELFSKGELRKIKSFVEDFFIIGIDQGKILLKTTKYPLMLLKPNDSKLYRVDTFSENRLVNVLFDQESSLFFFLNDSQNLYISTKNKKEWFETFFKDSKPLIGETIKKEEMVEKVQNIEERGFPQLNHFIPRYWFFSYEGGENTDEIWKIFTTISDPKNRHTVSLSYDIYPELSQTALVSSYMYSKNDFFMGGSREKTYTKNILGSEPDSTIETGANIGYNFTYKNYFYTPIFSVTKREENDFLSANITRKGTRFTIIESLGMKPYFRDDFFNSITLLSKIYYQNLDNETSYWGLQEKLNYTLRPTINLSINFQHSYGHLFKSKFINGVLFGGGNPTTDSNTFHEFYAIPYGHVFGNEILTNRMEFDYKFMDVYSAAGDLFPFFVKTLHALLGAEHLHGQRTFVDGQLFSNENIYSAYAGVSVPSTIFYLAPIDISILYTQILNSNIETANSWVTLIKGGYSF